jgi:hypothetical protein
MKIDHADGIILAFAAALGSVVALDATAAWFWRILIFCVVTFTLAGIDPAVRLLLSKLSKMRR